MADFMVKYTSSNRIIKTAAVLETPCGHDTRKVLLMQTYSILNPYFPANLDDYAPWVATHGLTAPYGECQCGCGARAPISAKNDSRASVRKNHPYRFFIHHGKRGDLAKIFWSNVTPGLPDECWLWRGSLSSRGYGVLQVGGKQIGAHRAAYVLHNGPLQDGMFACHTCDNPLCVNPSHIFAGTPMDNMRDKVNKGRQPHGATHPNARWTEDDIRKMKAMSEQGVSRKDIADLFGTAKSSVAAILRGDAWKHVE